MDGLIVTKGPELPWKFYRHCATQINSTHGILIGGQGRLKGSLIVDLNNNFKMSTGPDLAGIGRRDHMCTKFSYMNGNYVLVAGGKDLDNIPNLTTEILNVNDIGRGWTPGIIYSWILWNYNKEFTRWHWHGNLLYCNLI